MPNLTLEEKLALTFLLPKEEKAKLTLHFTEHINRPLLSVAERHHDMMIMESFRIDEYQWQLVVIYHRSPTMYPT